MSAKEVKPINKLSIAHVLCGDITILDNAARVSRGMPTGSRPCNWAKWSPKEIFGEVVPEGLVPEAKYYRLQVIDKVIPGITQDPTRGIGIIKQMLKDCGLESVAHICQKEISTTVGKRYNVFVLIPKEDFEREETKVKLRALLDNEISEAQQAGPQDSPRR